MNRPFPGTRRIEELGELCRNLLTPEIPASLVSLYFDLPNVLRSQPYRRTCTEAITYRRKTSRCIVPAMSPRRVHSDEQARQMAV